jgi:hypothetical protein
MMVIVGEKWEVAVKVAVESEVIMDENVKGGQSEW